MLDTTGPRHIWKELPTAKNKEQEVEDGSTQSKKSEHSYCGK